MENFKLDNLRVVELSDQDLIKIKGGIDKISYIKLQSPPAFTRGNVIGYSANAIANGARIVANGYISYANGAISVWNSLF